MEGQTGRINLLLKNKDLRFLSEYSRIFSLILKSFLSLSFNVFLLGKRKNVTFMGAVK